MTTRRLFPLCLLVLISCALLLTAVPALGQESEGGKDSGFRIVWDDFKKGFDAQGADAKWFYFAAGPYIGDDGIESISQNRLQVVASGTNAETGQPAFVRTIGQEDENPSGLPGGLDHVKWLVYMNQLSSRGIPGFDALPGQELACETWISGKTFGTTGHPFGQAVVNPEDDLRLASVAMNTVDLESWMVFDFFLTNERVYAFYERLPFGREQLGNYAAFSFMIPVAEREPNDRHHLKIAYDKAAGTVRWLVDDVEVFRVDQIGHLIDRQYMTIDHGGVEETVSPNQLNCGMGMFTLLDAHLPSGIGLVRLSSQPDFYFNPEVGAPEAETFVDDQSLESNRLFGQGAKLEILQYVVESRPAGK